ncbi:hypothetical protein CPB86DRAFT_738988 [Serendipita vermifera]|nr:hypothetical protein CPB86DRAFT_738988 [Serendipita vermifera]
MRPLNRGERVDGNHSSMNTRPDLDPLCYWVLLTSNLQFCYTSPSFNAVVPQASRLIGRGFLDYLHPSSESSESIVRRLHDSFHDEEDKGDVIILHYATVYTIRHHLQTGQFIVGHPGYTFYTYSMIVSRAGGFILAFMHVKTEFAKDCNFHLYEPLKSGDLNPVAPYLFSLDSNPPYHVFQIISADERRTLIFTTPTASPARVTINPLQLAEGTQSPRDYLTNRGVTSCTKRTKLSFLVSTLERQTLKAWCILVRHGSQLLAMYTLRPWNPENDTNPSILLPNEKDSSFSSDSASVFDLTGSVTLLNRVAEFGSNYSEIYKGVWENIIVSLISPLC